MLSFNGVVVIGVLTGTTYIVSVPPFLSMMASLTAFHRSKTSCGTTILFSRTNLWEGLGWGISGGTLART
jgi:hypothetical protein